MSTRKWSLIAILPVLASAIVLSIVVVRMVTSDPSESPSLVVDEDEQIEPVGNNPSSFVDEAPKLPVEVDVARSQLIVVGSIKGELGREFIPFVEEPANTPTDFEPAHGVGTIRYRFEVDRFIKGKRSTNELIVQVIDYIKLPIGETMVLMLVPWRQDSYQPSVWTAVSEDGGVLRYANGSPADAGSARTLDEYSEWLASIVAYQAEQGPPVPLAVPIIQAGDRISPAHYLGLGGSIDVIVANGRDGRTAQLDNISRSNLLSTLEGDILVETATLGGEEGNLTVTFKLAGGHIWEFEYDARTGTIIYPPAGLQAQLSAASRNVLQPAVATVQ